MKRVVQNIHLGGQMLYKVCFNKNGVGGVWKNQNGKINREN